MVRERGVRECARVPGEVVEGSGEYGQCVEGIFESGAADDHCEHVVAVREGGHRVPVARRWGVRGGGGREREGCGGEEEQFGGWIGGGCAAAVDGNSGGGCIQEARCEALDGGRELGREEGPRRGRVSGDEGVNVGSAGGRGVGRPGTVAAERVQRVAVVDYRVAPQVEGRKGRPGGRDGAPGGW